MVCHQSVRGDENLKVLFLRIASIVPGILALDQTGYEAGGHTGSIVLCDQWSLELIRALKVIRFLAQVQGDAWLAHGCHCKAHTKHELLVSIVERHVNIDPRVRNFHCYTLNRHNLIYLLTFFLQALYISWTPQLWWASLLLPLWLEPFWLELYGSSTRIQVRKHCIFTSQPWTHLTIVLIPCITLISTESYALCHF